MIGRGSQSFAYFHSIEKDHHVYINLETAKVFILPDNFEVKDSSLNDIKFLIYPSYSTQEIASLDEMKSCTDLTGKSYIPGAISLKKDLLV
jgi:U4/U6.U5 tri-snRNP-associated protein 2